MVITGLTRNQFASNRTRVRIPFPPPIKNDLESSKSFFVLGFEYVRPNFCGCSADQKVFLNYIHGLIVISAFSILMPVAVTSY